jgi:IclR family pca regulon transcriptional regulator
MSVLDGDDIVYVSRVSTSRIMAISIRVGTRFPAYVTSHASRSSLSALRRELLPPLLGTVARIEADLDVYPSPGRHSHAGA